MSTTRELLRAHFESHPALQIQDIFKFLFQSAFGCEHLVSSPEGAVAYIEKEYEAMGGSGEPAVEELDGDFCRVPLAYMKLGLSAETLGRLFVASAEHREDGAEALAEKIACARQMVSEGALPFSLADFDAAVAQWAEMGYPAVHHSETFREAYRPCYRVISKKFALFLPLFAQIDARLAAGKVTLSIEGGSASGKSTLSEILASVYECTVFHMDDFFLRPEQRTPERFAEAGGNVDRERFLEEVLLPLSRGETVAYRAFDCGTMQVKEAVPVTPTRLTVVEGAYSMHPALAPFYDLSVFLDVSPETQRARILRRNSPPMAKRFFEDWIPMEILYFNKTDAKKRCDIIISIL